MNKNENTKQLKMALTDRKPLNVYLKGDNDEDYWFYCKMEYVKEKDMYQGEFGCLPLDTVIQAADDLLPHIKLEVAEE